MINVTLNNIGEKTLDIGWVGWIFSVNLFRVFPSIKKWLRAYINITQELPEKETKEALDICINHCQALINSHYYMYDVTTYKKKEEKLQKNIDQIMIHLDIMKHNKEIDEMLTDSCL